MATKAAAVPVPNDDCKAAAAPVPAIGDFLACLCCTSCMGFFVFLCFAISGGILLIKHPECPYIDLDGLSVSNFNVTDNIISGDWEIGLNIRNPNGKTVLFKDIKYSVAWSGAPDQALVSGSEDRPVVLPTESQTALNLKGSAELLTLNNVMTGDIMRQDIVNSGFLAFKILLSGKVKYESDDELYHEYWSWDQIRVSLNSTPNTMSGAFHGNIPGQ